MKFFFTKVNCMGYRIRWENKNFDDMGTLNRGLTVFPFGHRCIKLWAWQESYSPPQSQVGKLWNFLHWRITMFSLFSALVLSSVAVKSSIPRRFTTLKYYLVINLRNIFIYLFIITALHTVCKTLCFFLLPAIGIWFHFCIFYTK